MTSSKYFYFPIELGHRELPSRLQIASHIVRLGGTCVFIDQLSFNKSLSSLPKGVIFHKDLCDFNVGKVFNQLEGKGWFRTALDEEGLVYFSEEAYIDSRLGHLAPSHCDMVFAWGEAQAKVLVRSKRFADAQIKITGHPKFEIHKNLCAGGGEYILVNTRFGAVNNFLNHNEQQYIDRMKAVGEVTDSASEEFRRRYFSFIGALMSDFLDLIVALARAFPDRRIRIRKHPVEADSVYARLARENPNVELSSGVALEDDLANAELLIHNGCTTGIEALVAGLPVFVYEPIPTPLGDMALPNKFGVVCKTIDQLILRINELGSLGYDFERAMNELDRYVLVDDQLTSSRKIAELLFANGVSVNTHLPCLLRLFFLKCVLVCSRYIPNFLIPRFLGRKLAAFSYVDAKFQINHEELIRQLELRGIKSSRLKIKRFGLKAFAVGGWADGDVDL